MNKNSLPPGPRSTLFAMLRYGKDPYEAMLWAARKYGDPFTWPSLFGKMVVTGDPAALRTLFTSAPELFAVPGAEIMKPVIGKSNLILLHGEQHRAMRKLQTPPFHGSRMRAYGQLIRDITEEQAQSWAPGQAFCMHRSAQEISLQVILQAVLGLSSQAMRQDFKAAVLALMESLKPSFLFMPALRREFLGLSAWSRFVRTRQRVIALFTQELTERRATPRPRQDIMSLLMEARYEDGAPLSDEELFEQMANLIVAGHETTASALAWACYFIHRDDAVKERLVQELRALLTRRGEPEALRVEHRADARAPLRPLGFERSEIVFADPGLRDRQRCADQCQQRHDDRAALVGAPDQLECRRDVAIGRAQILHALAPGLGRLGAALRRARARLA